MKLENTLTFDVDTPGGTGILQNVYITELGLVMAKVFFPKREVWINYRLSEVNNSNNLKINIDSLKINGVKQRKQVRSK